MFCSFCKEDKKDGIRFLNTVICYSCLEGITKAKVEDDEYNDYIEAIKDILKECQLNY